MYDVARITVEVVSTIICFALVWFMTKPYKLTRETRYVGLPLGFAVLGISYAISAFAYSYGFGYFFDLLWIQLLMRTFAFVFIAVTYYFSKVPTKNTPIFWAATFSLLIVTLIALFLAVFILPQFVTNGYKESQLYIRVFNVVCLVYIVFHTLRSHIKKPDPTTIWIPLGFILLAVSQYSLLFWYIDTSYGAFFSSLAIRVTALGIFLFVALKSFYTPREGEKNEDPT